MKDGPSDPTPTASDAFWYGPDGQRFLRKAQWDDNGTTRTRWTLYLLGGTFEEVHPDASSGVDYVQRSQLSATVQHRYTQTGASGSSTFDYIHRDHLGSVDVITDEAGATLRNVSFDPYGGRRSSNWSSDISSAEFADVLSDADGLTGRGFTNHEHLNR